MPRRLPVRPAKIIGNLFVLFVLLVIGLIYYTYVFVIWGPRAVNNLPVMVMLAFFNLIFVLLSWSFFQAMTTDPGQVPVFWGFHLGDPENKRRRYCLMCNVFKPERCHHCSACNRCVLNMDHHCPWINNCVGFWNRKYFLLLLIYVLIGTYFIAVSMFYDFAMSIKWELDAYYLSKTARDQQMLLKSLLIQLSYILNCLIGVLMTFFLKFHIYLATTNKTTIENLDKKGRDFKSVYDIGRVNNLYQIFGTNKLLWPFPMFLGSGKPLGDGIYWPTNIKEDEQFTSYQGQNESAEKRRLSPSRVGDQSAGNKYGSVLSPGNPQYTPSQPSYRTNLGGQFGAPQYDPNNPNSATIPVQYGQFQSQDLTPEQLNVGGQPRGITQYPQQQQYFGGSQVYGQQQNRIIMHGQDRDTMKKNLNAAIFQNNQRAQQLNQQIVDRPSREEEKQMQQRLNRTGGGLEGEASSGRINPKKKRIQGTEGVKRVGAGRGRR